MRSSHYLVRNCTHFDLSDWLVPMAIICPLFKTAILLHNASHSSMLCEVRRSEDSELSRTADNTSQMSRRA